MGYSYKNNIVMLTGSGLTQGLQYDLICSDQIHVITKNSLIVIDALKTINIGYKYTIQLAWAMFPWKDYVYSDNI
jgi:hypothetical protein